MFRVYATAHDDPLESRVKEIADDIAIAFVGTYGPRRCGIATFTADLASAVVGSDGRASRMILAVTEPHGRHQYPSEVEFEIRQNVKADYARAAEFVNYSRVRLVSIQHEYGIFGGDDGGYILDFVRALRVPVIVTLHTVLKHPSENQAAIVKKLAKRCARLVVMSQVAKDLLASSYGIAADQVQLIPHGIPVIDDPTQQQAMKSTFGIEGRRMLLTFGLLSPSKGIETVISALPKVVRAFPDLIYFVVGATHPVILQREGEAYRTMLEREAERLGVREHLAFRGQFVSSDKLSRYLQAADVFVSPYLNEAQVTSGALSYAMGAGAAVVSTPYWHAQELLADGRGRLFPFKDHEALSQTLLGLFENPGELARVRHSARSFAQSMAWPRIGDAYFTLVANTLATHPGPRPFFAPAAATPASSLPELCLDHLRRLTDDTGIIQHATYSVPARRTGYCVDDNARALIVAVQAERLDSSAATRALVTNYLSYLYLSQEADGRFNNFMSYGRVLENGAPSDDCTGRAVWALGLTTELALDAGCQALAREMLFRALPHVGNLGPRGTAQVALGLVSVLNQHPDAAEVRNLLQTMVSKLCDVYERNSTADWKWFEPTLTYDNAIVPLALYAAYKVTADRSCLRVARESLEFLEESCFEGDRLQLIGNEGWFNRGGEKARTDEQAIDATAFVLAFQCAYAVTNERHYLTRMRQAFSWFLGANRLGVPLYDFETGGCKDGLGENHVNQNQGAESTVCFLMALLEMLDLAGEGADSNNASNMNHDL